MKKSSKPARHRQSYRINEYAHDRTVHSLGRGASNARKKQKRLRGILISLILVIVLAAAVWLLWPYLPWGGPNGSSETTTPPTTSQDISPTPVQTTQTSAPTTTATTTEATTETTTEATTTINLEERRAKLDDAFTDISSLLEGEPGRFGVYFYNLATGESFEYNADQPFVAASSSKLGTNTYLYTKIASGEVSPDDILTYDNRPYPTGDYEPGTGTIQNGPNGVKLTVRETSRLSITISDNCAINMIIRSLGGIDAINPYFNEISGIIDYREKISYTNYDGKVVSGRHRSCPLDLGSQAIELYRLWKETPAVYQPLIDDLCHTKFDFGIQKGVPSDILVAHKIGTNGTYSAENDVGIVFGTEPFVLCVMTEMFSAERGRQIEGEVAKIIYDCLESLQD